MTTTPSSLVIGADDNLDPFERRHPEYDQAHNTVYGVDSYSVEQGAQVERILPIKFCVYPEYWLDDALPQHIPADYKEGAETYNVRKTRALSCFEPFYSHFRNIIIGTALRKGVLTPSDTSDQWKEFFKNTDLQGLSITSFAKELFTKAFDGGVAGIWSEYPFIPQGTSPAERQKMGARPYFKIFSVDDVLDCREETGPVTINGGTTYETRVAYLRVKSEIRRPSAANEHFEEVVPTVVVYDLVMVEENGGQRERVRVRTYEKSLKNAAASEYTELISETGEPVYLSIDFIPFTPCYGGTKEAFFRARPLLYDIARMNLRHWATVADLAENIHLNAGQILTATGIRAEEDIYGGGGRALTSENPEAKFGMLSPAMQGADSTLREIARLEASMSRLAAITMTPGKTQAESGFAKLLDRSQADSELAVLVASLQDSINRALRFAAAYDNYEPVEITISKNFIPVKLHSQQVMAFSSLFKDSNAITIGAFLKMLEAGELFEGLTGFSVDEMLEDMGLTGKERAIDLGIGSAAKQIAPEPPATNNIQNTMEESTGDSLHSESSEASLELTES